MPTRPAKPRSPGSSKRASCRARKAGSSGSSGRGATPVVDGKAEREVKLRIMGVLLSDDIPDPRDIAIIGLCDACGILDHMLAPRELAQARERIDQVSRLDLIGQSVANVIEQTRALSQLRSDL